MIFTSQKYNIILLFLFWNLVSNAQITGIKINANPCDGLTIDLQALGTSNSPYFSWDFGDPSSGINNTAFITGLSPSPYPTHTFSGAGVYTVCVSFQEPGFPVTTICRTLLVGFCCDGQIVANATCDNNNIPFTLVTNDPVLTINWNFGDPSSGANNTSADFNPTHTFSATGNFIVTAVVTANCGNFTVTYPVTVTPGNTPTFNPIPAFCSGLTAPVLPATSLEGIAGTWSPPIVSNTAGAIYTFTPNAGQCATSQTLTTTVSNLITPTFNPIPALCAGSIAPVLPATSLEGIAGTWSPPIVSNTTGTMYTFTPNAGQCATSQTLTTIVSNLITPTFNPIPAFCSGSIAPVLPATSLEGITGIWSPPIVSNTTGAMYTFTPNAGQCALIPVQLTVNIVPTITPTFTVIQPFCSGSIAQILPSTSVNGIAGTWSPAIVDNAQSGTYIFTPNANQCADTIAITTTILPLTEPDFVDLNLCATTTTPFTLNTVSPNGISGTWSPAVVDYNNSSTYTFTPNAGECAVTKTIIINPNQSIQATYTTTNPFSNPATITVSVTSSGTFLYQLDNGTIQSSPLFEKVSSGFHDITIYDSTGCFNTLILENILIIDYPKFFTPNDDNSNDYWNITNLRLQHKTSTFIFDRFGKLLKQIQPNELGWDGRYNNENMPASDYWFVVNYEYNNVSKEFKGHFSLIR